MRPGCRSAWRHVATGAVVLGALAGLVLALFALIRGRALLQGLTTAPLVMPEVITGLSMLLLFVSLELFFRIFFAWQFDRGMVTITIAHITFTMSYVTVVVQSRLATFDDSLEEAALDLGAKPAKVFSDHAATDRQPSCRAGFWRYLSRRRGGLSVRGRARVRLPMLTIRCGWA
jgi:ABC-type sulfate transport system permease component